MTLSELSDRLGRPAHWIRRTQKRFGLPVLKEYPECYVNFLRKIRDLLNLRVSDEKLSELWDLEKKLIDILHLDLVGGELSVIEGCSTEADPDHRLLLTNADLGVPLTARDVQAGLDFLIRPQELFAEKEMGADFERMINRYRILLQEVMDTSTQEAHVIKETLKWIKTIGFPPRHV